MRDIELDLNEIVLPANLVADETLDSVDIEEEPKSEYKVDTCCNTCSASVRLVVAATGDGIRHLEFLLVHDRLAIVCARCARNRRDGRR